MKKSLFNIAVNIQGGILESRLLARTINGKELTDEETIKELEYQLYDLPTKGLEPEEERNMRKAIKYVLNKYSK